MSVLSIPNVFVQGTTINSAPFNTNFSAVQTAVNNVDNSNIGASGLFASQLLPTTLGQATFGGAIGYLHLAPSASTTPLTISGVTSQSADIFDVTLTSGGTKAFFIDKNGIANFNGILSALPNSVAITGTGGSVNATINSGSGGTCSITSGAGGSGFAPVNGGLYTNASDAKLKENIVPITNALILLAQLKPSSYDWVEHKQADLGFIAQDVEAVLPQLVRNHENGIKGLVYTGITALNSAAIMELYAEFKAYVTAHP